MNHFARILESESCHTCKRVDALTYCLLCMCDMT